MSQPVVPSRPKSRPCLASGRRRPCLRLFQRYGRQFPFQRIITHRYPLAPAEAALLKSLEPDTMKVGIQR